MLIIPAIDIKDGRCVRLFQGDMDKETIYFEREVGAICKETGLAVQLGGGLRSVDAVKAALDLGIARVVIGTAAYDNPQFLRDLCKRFPEKVVVGIDARGGKVAVKGWKETTAMDAIELARRCEADGAARIIYTDISRDGTREGVNIEETGKLAQSIKIPIIASGGVATLDDIRRLLPLEEQGVQGVIVGRALYSGSFTLKAALGLGAPF